MPRLARQRDTLDYRPEVDIVLWCMYIYLGAAIFVHDTSLQFWG